MILSFIIGEILNNLMKSEYVIIQLFHFLLLEMLKMIIIFIFYFQISLTRERNKIERILMLFLCFNHQKQTIS
jgi:hypothetical protein